MLHTNCHALHFTLPSDAKIQKNAVACSHDGYSVLLACMKFVVTVAMEPPQHTNADPPTFSIYCR